MAGDRRALARSSTGARRRKRASYEPVGGERSSTSLRAFARFSTNCARASDGPRARRDARRRAARGDGGACSQGLRPARDGVFDRPASRGSPWKVDARG